jgi:hypothetical protein
MAGPVNVVKCLRSNRQKGTSGKASARILVFLSFRMSLVSIVRHPPPSAAGRQSSGRNRPRAPFANV